LIGGQPVPTGPTTPYFAEGDTGQARTKGQATFEETLALHNTTLFPATVTLTYVIEGAKPLLVTHVIPSHGTLQESVNRDVEPDRRVAAIVTSPSRLTAHPYTRWLLAAAPNPAQPKRQVEARGEIPSLINPQPSCRFAARCPMAMDICRRRTPEITEICPGHWARRYAATPVLSVARA
jgi:oligopeptide/dipeptide ABC transporter ATP-binding protein